MNAHSAPLTAAGCLPKVYSYTRFSTPEQANGDSARRQSDAAAKWATDRGIELDTTLTLAAPGISAYRGRNTEGDKGLGGFLYACRSGLIEEGSYLLVESLDRISRMTPRKVQRLLDDIVDAGVTIVTLNDGQEYTQDRLDNDPTALLIALMVSWRAHEESKTKGRRVAAAWSEKRRRVREGTAPLLTRRSPPWLRWNGCGWEVDDKRAEVVRRVYRMTIEGAGEHRVAATLNAEGVEPLGRGTMWHRSAVSKLLRTSTVIGVLTPGYMSFEGGKKRRLLEEPIANAYPSVVSTEDWHTVRSIKDGLTAPLKGRGAGKPLANVFSGLARCPDCGSAMTRVMKGSGPKGGKPKLVCTRAKAGAASHPYQSVDLTRLEEAFQRDWQALLADVPSGEAGGSLDSTCHNLEAAISATEDKLECMATDYEARPSSAIAARLRGVEAELASLKASLREAEDRRTVADGGLIHARLGQLQELIEGGDAPAAPINALLRSLLSDIIVNHHEGRLEFHWKQGGATGLVYSMPPV